MPADADETLAQQFQELERKSGNYKAKGVRYEVVPTTALNRIKTSVFDSISAAKASIKKLSATIATHVAEIESLHTTLQETTHQLNTVTASQDKMTFLGVVVKKNTYRFIFWAVVFILLLLLSFFIYKFSKSSALTRQARTALVDLEKEYEAHKRRALEREQKISRELQDELNKQKKQ